MARPALAVCCWLCSAAVANCAISLALESDLRRAVGNVTDNFLMCERAAPTCDIGWLAQMVRDSALSIRNSLNQYPAGVGFGQSDCDTLRSRIMSDLPALKKICSPAGGWPGECIKLQLSLTSLLDDPTYEVGVICNMINPGPGRVRTPKCSSLVSATLTRALTLTDCANFNKSYCVDNFCELYTQFRWRIYPANLQTSSATNPFPSDFVLPGCEEVANHPFSAPECPLRRDVNGFCDCICKAMPTVQFQNGRNCPREIDAYLMFGRMGVDGVRMNKDCEPDLCGMFDANRELDRCLDLTLPTRQECEAYQLPKVPLTCAWLHSSGEEGVLQCLDGSRCSVKTDGFSCCADSHLGRAQCPEETPVMCDNLCSGTTEYCCGSLQTCTPRKCPPILNPDPVYFPPTTTVTSTTEPPGDGKNEVKGILALRLPEGSWVWLFLIVPCCIGSCLFAVWLRNRRKPELFDEAPAKLEENVDRWGAFYTVRPSPVIETENKRSIVYIDVDELPQLRPLGLELAETKVLRVYPQARHFGWQPGDVIVEIAGVAVATFEELWERLQVERDRVPVRFMVQRLGVEHVTGEELRATEAPAKLSRVAKVRIADEPALRSAVASSEEVALQAQASSPSRPPGQAWLPAAGSQGADSPGGTRGLASAMVGWQTWSYPQPGDEDSVTSEGSQKRTAQGPAVGNAYRQEVVTTRFMRAFPLTEDAQIKRFKDGMGKHRDPTANDVRWVRDAWGRSVVKVGS